MGRVVVHDEVGAAAVGVSQRSSELDEELLDALGVCRGRLHVKMSTVQTLANSSEQSDRAEVLLIDLLDVRLLDCVLLLLVVQLLLKFPVAGMAYILTSPRSLIHLARTPLGSL